MLLYFLPKEVPIIKIANAIMREIEIEKSLNKDVKRMLRPMPYNTVYGLLLKADESMVKLFLSRPVDTTDYITWMLPIEDLAKDDFKKTSQSLDSLSEVERSLALAFIQEKQDFLLDYLKKAEDSKNRDKLRRIADCLFQTPNGESDYKVWNKQGELVVTLTQWALKLDNKRYKPSHLSTRVITPAKPHKVEVAIFDQDDSPLGRQDFIVVFQGNGGKELQNKMRTCRKGLKSLGSHDANVAFKIFKVKGEEILFVHDFVVLPEDKTYKVVFPYLAEAEIIVVNQDKKTLEGVKATVSIDNDSANYSTDFNGKILLGEQIVGLSVQVNLPDFAVAQNFTIEKRKNSFLIEVVQPKYENATIIVQDQNGNNIPNYPLSVVFENATGKQKLELTTDELGKTGLEEVLTKTKVIVEDGNSKNNSATYAVEEGAKNEFIFGIHVKIPRKIEFQIKDANGNPWADKEVLILVNKKKFKMRTDNSGFVIGLADLDIQNGDKVELNIDVDKKSNYKKIKLV
jgi:hypothetical protein